MRNIPALLPGLVPTILLALWWGTLNCFQYKSAYSSVKRAAGRGKGVWWCSWCWYLTSLPNRMKGEGGKKHILLTHSHVVFIYSSRASNLGISDCFLRQVKCLKSCVVICLDGMHMCVIFKRSEWVRILEKTISQLSFSFSSFYLFPCGLKGNKHGGNNNRTSLCSLNLCLWHSPFQHSLFTRKPEHFHPNLSALQLCSFSV